MIDLAERALAAARGDEAEAFVHSERSGLARFAGSEIHQPTLIENVLVRLRLVRDGRVGWASTNRIGDDALGELARRAGEAADAAPQDPDFPGLVPAAELPAVAGYDEETAALGGDGQARLARAAIDAAGDFELYGFVTTGVTELAVASTTGLRAGQRLTDATALVLAAQDGASGYAEATSWAAPAIDPARVTREAVAKGARTRGAVDLSPGSYGAVLEPYALAELIDYFAFDTFNGLALVEERSPVAGKLGERLYDEKVSLWDDALDPRGLPKAFDFEGAPKERVPLVERGVVRGAVWDRATAARAGERPTGHAPPPELRTYGPIPFALSVAPGEAASSEELAGLVGDGIYITRIHYPSVVNPREGVITGMTRDGTFRIRDGRIAEPLVNLRFTVSVPAMLEQVPGLTRETRLVNRSEFYGERYPFGVVCPALATARFTITGTGSGPGL